MLVLELNEEEPPAEVGPYGDTEPGSARQVFESHLHEIAHHVTLYDRFASVRATIDIVPHGQGMPKPLGVTIDDCLSPISADANEIDTIAVEVLVSRRLGHPINVRRIVTAASEHGNFRVLGNPDLIVAIVNRLVDDCRLAKLRAQLVVKRLRHIVRSMRYPS